MAYDELDRLLRRIHAPLDAPECHGALCGALCAPEPSAEAWLAHALGDTEPARAARAALLGLAQAVQRQLQDGDFAFAPCLPDYDAPLADRSAALGEWCEGFLAGFGGSRIEQFDRLPEAVQEIVRDLIEMARVGMPAGDDPDGDEAALTELIEYLRVGVQLVYDELHPAPASPVLDAPSTVQ